MKKFRLKSSRLFIGLALASFVLSIFSFALEDSMGVEVIRMGGQGNCLTVSGDHDKMCENAFAEHLSLWQAMFTALPQEKSLLGVFGAIVIAVLTFIFQRYYLLLSEAFSIRQRQYLKRHPSFLVFDFLRTLFSQGILNPKAHILSAI